MQGDAGLCSKVLNFNVVDISQHDRLLKVAFSEYQSISCVADFVDYVTVKSIIL